MKTKKPFNLTKYEEALYQACLEELKQLRPEDGFVGNVEVGEWEPFVGIDKTQGRFNSKSKE